MSSAHVYQKCSSYLATSWKTLLESQTPEYNTVPICIYVHIYVWRDICGVIFSIKEYGLGEFLKITELVYYHFCKCELSSKVGKIKLCMRWGGILGSHGMSTAALVVCCSQRDLRGVLKWQVKFTSIAQEIIVLSWCFTVLLTSPVCLKTCSIIFCYCSVHMVLNWSLFGCKALAMKSLGWSVLHLHLLLETRDDRSGQGMDKDLHPM